MTAVMVAMSAIAPITSLDRSSPEAARSAEQSTQNAQDRRANRSSRRPTSHYNTFQTSCHVSNDAPPAYASLRKLNEQSQSSSRSPRERLPRYSCSVATEGKVWLRVESISPLHGLIESPWKEVYLVLRGTLLLICQAKDEKPGKLLRTYTLQHAEVGLATDAAYTVLVPQTRLARLIPQSHRQRASQKDSSLYRPSKQSILRLRVEAEQLVIAHCSEERIFQLVNLLSAAIDISMAIDERSISRQCTVPRRRRRRTISDTNDVEDPALRAEQEQILQEMYPTFAEPVSSNTRPELSRTITEDSLTVEARRDVAAAEEDEIDLAAMREDLVLITTGSTIPASDPSPTTRPHMTRVISSSTVSSSSLASTHNHSEIASSNDKRNPSSSIQSDAQIARYVRRCMPVLLADATRASDVFIHHQRRVRINWRLDLLEDWELKPPSYRAHKFPVVLDPLAESGSENEIGNGHDGEREIGSEEHENHDHENDLRRTISHEAALSSHSTPLHTTRSLDDHASHTSCGASCDERIEPVESPTTVEELSKGKGKLLSTRQSRDIRESRETREARDARAATMVSPAQVPGVIFCF